MALTRHSSLLLILLASLIISTAMGLRHGFGLFLEPMSSELGWGRGVFALALAIQNLMWGLAQPFTGALADRFGAARIIVAGGVLYVLGLCFMSLSTSALGMTLSAGLLIGIGLSGTTFSVILGAVGRAVPAEKRSMAMGIVSAAGSFGQFAMLPGTLGLIEWLGWSAALLAMGMIAAVMIPLGAMLKDRPRPHALGDLSLRDALNEAAGQKGFWLLCLGFFVCGFQVVFIAVHLPGYLFDNGLAVQVGTTVLALVGLFNIVGTYTAGWLGGNLVQAALAQLAVPDPRRGHYRVSGRAPQRLQCLRVWYRHGLAVALDRATDQRHRGVGVWCQTPLHAGRHRVSVPPVGVVHGRLARRLPL